MTIVPGGDKLRPGQPYRPKSETLPKVKRESSLDVYVAAIIGGIAIAEIGGMELVGYGITSLGGAVTALEFIKSFNPYKRLFENLNIKVGDRIPRYLGKKKTDYGYCLKFSLPYGLSTKDFEKHQLEIEQYFNNKIKISYKNHRVFIQIYQIALEESPKYILSPTKGLEFPIGIIYGGEIIKLDLEKVVHLLVAGETGSGKSTVLRAILTSLIANNKKISLHLIDLKNGAEFNVFRKCKQVKSFSRNIDDAEKVLMDLLHAVDKRYELFYENDVVDIKEYNKLKNVRKLDYQVCVIDEFADLQDEKGSISAVETLAAKARACGIHLIISTQRPDAKILNGRIKANVPCVMGLKTMNSLNSRIIIDENGLEELRGKGHGLLRYGDLTEFQSMDLSVKDAREFVKHTYIEKDIKKETKDEVIEDFGFLELIK
ncbi:MAG: DNA translocase FtsK [Tissierella sp.]|nr:DNA translocase FtsK [Tissierella sp.]